MNKNRSSTAVSVIQILLPVTASFSNDIVIGNKARSRRPHQEYTSLDWPQASALEIRLCGNRVHQVSLPKLTRREPRLVIVRSQSNDSRTKSFRSPTASRSRALPLDSRQCAVWTEDCYNRIRVLNRAASSERPQAIATGADKLRLRRPSDLFEKNESCPLNRYLRNEEQSACKDCISSTMS